MHSKIHHILKKKKLIKSIKTKFIWLHSSPVHHKLIAKNIYIYIIYVNNNLNKNENFFLDSTCVCLVLVSIIGFLVGVWRRNALPGVSKLLGIVFSEVSISPHVLLKFNNIAWGEKLRILSISTLCISCFSPFKFLNNSW